jgi:NTP pyrophosphatase (non-canonical NTP hydrolase)
LNLTALQTTLRQFAAEREWQPFHTPKNLAMAMMVEAAELAEIFQWMTPEQSQSAHTDAVMQEQIGDEIADVLLYLIQIADHTAVDLKRAVGRKLIKNGKKYPPVRPGLPSGPAAVSLAETHVLLDWENVQPGDAAVRDLVPDVTDVWLFHGLNQKKAGAGFVSFGDRFMLIPIARSGPNALDFHLSFYMGYIASRHPTARFVVVSNDKGYAPMLEHAQALGFAARQIGYVAPRTAGKPAPAKKASAKKVSVKRPVAKKPTPPASAEPAVVKKAAAAKKIATTRRTAPAKAAEAGAVSDDLMKAVLHVESSLKKMASPPPKEAKLIASVNSLLGERFGEPTRDAVLKHFFASGKITIGDDGRLTYRF